MLLSYINDENGTEILVMYLLLIVNFMPLFTVLRIMMFELVISIHVYNWYSNGTIINDVYSLMNTQSENTIFKLSVFVSLIEKYELLTSSFILIKLH
jgi:hypothetical protein